jgi:branched-subunit amino acid aminotransferase/4-amino-4-deoxychorismate lyase
MTDTINTKLEFFAVLDDDVETIQTPEKDAIIRALYSGLPLGVYTGMRTYEHNQFLHLEEHITRLEESIAALGWDFQLNRRALRQALHQVCTGYKQLDARVRIDVLAAGEIQLATGSRVLISLSPYSPIPDSVYQNGVRVRIEAAIPRSQPEVKKAEFAVTRRKYLERDPSRYECLIIDSNRYIVEGTTSNFYGVRNDVLWTAGFGVLEGIARGIILKLAGDAHIPVRLDPISADDLATLSESALSSASRGLVPIVQIADQTIGDGRPGPITRKLIEAYQAYVVREIRTAV